MAVIVGLRYGMRARTGSAVSCVCTELLISDLLPSTGTAVVPG